MSALDQALTKAYDKPTVRPPAAPPPSQAVASPAPVQRPAVNFAAIETLYRDGGLYRIDPPAARDVPHQAATAARAARETLSGPHFAVPPPTSPKRGMRRSMLRLLANQLGGEESFRLVGDEILGVERRRFG